MGGKRVVGQHNSDLDTHDTLSEADVSDSSVHVGDSGLTGVNHVSVSELHGLSSLLSELAGDDDFATLGTLVEHLSDDVHGGGSGGDTDEESLDEVLGLLLGVEAVVGSFLGEEDELVIGGSVKAESLFDEALEFLDFDSGGLGRVHEVVELADEDSDFSGVLGEVDFDAGKSEIG